MYIRKMEIRNGGMRKGKKKGEDNTGKQEKKRGKRRCTVKK